MYYYLFERYPKCLKKCIHYTMTTSKLCNFRIQQFFVERIINKLFEVCKLDASSCVCVCVCV